MISVVVPTHNRPDFVRRLLASVSGQVFADFEVLVVTNFPDRRLDKILNDLEPALKCKVKLLVRGAQGANRARNMGIDASRGELIFLLDDDCYLPDHLYLARIAACQAREPAALAIGGGYLDPPRVGKTARWYNRQCNRWLGPDRERPRPSRHLLGGCVVYRRAPLRELNLRFDEEIEYGGAETEFHERLRAAGKYFWFYPGLSVVHDCRVSVYALGKKAARQGRGFASRPGVSPDHAENDEHLSDRLRGAYYAWFFSYGERLADPGTRALPYPLAFLLYPLAHLTNFLVSRLRPDGLPRRVVRYLRWRLGTTLNPWRLRLVGFLLEAHRSLTEKYAAKAYEVLESKGRPVWVLALSQSRAPQPADGEVLYEISSASVTRPTDLERFESEARRLGRACEIVTEALTELPHFLRERNSRILLRQSTLNREPQRVAEWLNEHRLPLQIGFVLDETPRPESFAPLRALRGKIKSAHVEIPTENGNENGEALRNLRDFSRLVRDEGIHFERRFRLSDLTTKLEVRSRTSTRIHDSSPTTPRISVVIPHQGDLATLPAVLTALSRQSLSAESFEIVVVDNGSANHLLSPAAIQQFCDQFKELRLTFIQALSPDAKLFLTGQARNLGIENSTGEILQFLDADIVLPSTYLADLIDRMRDFDVVMAKRHMLRANFRAEQTSVEHIHSGHWRSEDLYWEVFKSARRWVDLRDYWRYACTYCLAVKRIHLDRAGSFDCHFINYGFEDVDLALRLYQLEARFGFAASWVYHLPPRKILHNYHANAERRQAALRSSAATLVRLRPERLTYRLCHGYFAEALKEG